MSANDVFNVPVKCRNHHFFSPLMNKSNKKGRT